MADIFSASEIVEVAVQIEKNGREFYRVLTDKTKDIKAKEVFKFLLDEEDEHVVIFEKILNSLNKYEPAESYPGEYFSYMNALASEHVFTQEGKGRVMAGKIESYQEAIDMGIGFEKDSIIFYEGVKKIVRDSDVKVIDRVIKEEQEHFSKLTGIKKYLELHPES